MSTNYNLIALPEISERKTGKPSIKSLKEKLMIRLTAKRNKPEGEANLDNQSDFAHVEPVETVETIAESQVESPDGMADSGAGSNSSKIKRELALLRKAKQGDTAAFEELITTYQPSIRKLLNRYLRHAEDAMDANQEVLIRVWKALPKFRGEASFHTWVYRIALNVAHGELKKQKLRYTTEQPLPEFETLEKDNELEVLDSTSTFETGLAKQVDSAISALGTVIRDAYILREVRNMSYEEIAQIQGCPIGTVRSRIFRARESLGAMLQEYLD